jgi:hypothetical protein
MKNRNLILSGITLVVLAMLVTTVYAGENLITTPPFDHEPRVYLLKKDFDTCDPNDEYGSVPPSGRQYGCVDFLCDLRWNEYAFTGERIRELVAVRDLAGSIDILSSYLWVDTDPVVKCNQVEPNFKCYGPENSNCPNIPDETTCKQWESAGCYWSWKWYGHDIDLTQIPQKGPAPQGYATLYDKLYECILTVTENMGEVDSLEPEPEVVGRPAGSEESCVFVRATDEIDGYGDSPIQQWYFNPAISVNVYTSDGDNTPIQFETPFGAGQTVYSTNTLKIKNEAEGGVDLYVWIAGSDLISPEVPAKCPISNVLESDNIEYRCKIGTMFNNPWHDLENPNDKLDCTKEACQAATRLLPDWDPVLNVLGNQHTAECWFRLNWPVPCIGEFTDGMIYIYARAI